MHPWARHGAAARKRRILARKCRFLTRYSGDPIRIADIRRLRDVCKPALPVTSNAGRERPPVDLATTSAGRGSPPNCSANRTGCRWVWAANWAVRTDPHRPRIPPVGLRRKEGGGRAQVLNTNKKARAKAGQLSIGINSRLN